MNRQQELFTVVRNDQLELVAAVPARRAGEVQPGQLVRFSADGRELTGRVARVSPTIDPASRAVTVYLQVPNPKGALKGNTFATGRVVGRVVDDAVLVPVAALRQPAAADAPPFVYMVKDGAIAIAPLKLGLVDDVAGMAQVLEGLAVNDVVITGNVGTLGRGMKVQVVGGDKKGKGDAKEVPAAR